MREFSALAGIPEDAMQVAVLVECPRMLFPFARHIVADATRDGSFPPLMIDPVDFAAHCSVNALKLRPPAHHKLYAGK